MIKIYTHGACKGNPGVGGWAAVLVDPKCRKALQGSAPHTTNNRMELTAALEGLRALHHPSEVHVYSSSQYLHNGMESWMSAWKQRDFKTKGGTPVKNEDLWRALDEQSSRHNVKWNWVGRHSSDPESELADQLANGAIEDRFCAACSDRNLVGKSSPAPIRTEGCRLPLPDGSSQDVEVKIYEAAWAEGAARQVHGRVSNKLRS
jgi:ribonuclease HI